MTAATEQQTDPARFQLTEKIGLLIEADRHVELITSSLLDDVSEVPGPSHETIHSMINVREARWRIMDAIVGLCDTLGIKYEYHAADLQVDGLPAVAWAAAQRRPRDPEAAS